jgi:hypothetical protein
LLVLLLLIQEQVSRLACNFGFLDTLVITGQRNAPLTKPAINPRKLVEL